MRRVLLVLILSTTVLADGVVTVRRGVSIPASANLLAETFDTTGPDYDNTWTDNTSGGGTVAPNSTTNPPVGACTGFATQALKLTATAFEMPNIWADIGTAQTGEVDFRGYLFIESETIATSGSAAIVVFDDATAPAMTNPGVARIELAETAGDQLHLSFYIATGSSAGTVNVTTGTCYLVEFKWNDTANLASAKVDGVAVFTDSALNPGAATEFIALGIENTAAAAIYWDTVGVGNTGYIGP